MKNRSLTNFKNERTCENIVKRSIKSAICVALTGLFTLSAVNVSAADYDKAKKELRIMSKIFDTSLADASANNANRVFSSRTGGNQSTYLAQQGMVFTFSFSNSDFGSADDWQAFGEGVGRLVGTIASEVTDALSEMDTEIGTVPRAPRAPRPISGIDGWDNKIEAYEAYQDAMDELRDEQSDRREEVRDMQREIRELERESRHNNKDKEKLEETKQKLQKSMAELEKKKAEYQKSMEEYREKKNQKERERNNKKSETIISTLCDYGSTLRSLDNDEHVTLIFSDYQDNKDQVYVFSSEAVKECSSKDKLIKQAISYQL